MCNLCNLFQNLPVAVDVKVTSAEKGAWEVNLEIMKD